MFLFFLRVPYIALARTWEEVENISARLKMIKYLSNFFRSVIVQTPDELLPCVYLCLNQLAPAYEGKLKVSGKHILQNSTDSSTELNSE